MGDRLLSGRTYSGQGGLPIKRYIGKLYLTEPCPTCCIFARSFLACWENTREFQVAGDQSWVRLNAENGSALYRYSEDGPSAGEGIAMYKLKEASWNAPPPFASPEQLAMEWK